MKVLDPIGKLNYRGSFRFPISYNYPLFYLLNRLKEKAIYRTNTESSFFVK